MSSKQTACALALMDTPVQNSVPMVDVTVPIRTDTLEKIDALCEACKPVEMTREQMLRLMVQTGLLYWENQSETDSSEPVNHQG
jgi:hypothetical protein